MNDWPPPELPPPTPWPAPAVGPAPQPRANRVVLAVSLSLVALAIIALGVIAAARTGSPAAVVGPGYETLTDAEIATVARQADAVGAELDAWWAAQLRDTPSGEVFAPVGDRLTDGDDGVRCDGERIVMDDDLLDNAWASLCPEGPTVAYDPATFRRSDVALEVILAHEWGHIAQALDPQLDEIIVDPDAPYAETELQADCYAGAWAAENFTAAEVAIAVAELRAIGDPPGTPDDDPDGHGSPDERETAFRLGLDGGLAVCLPDAFDAR